MPIRRLAVIALACAVLLQAGWIWAYHRATGGCFCWVTGTPNPPRQPDFVYRYIELVALPLGGAAGPVSIRLPGVSAIVAEWLGALAFAAVNAFFWFDALFLLMVGAMLIRRIRVRRGRRPFALAEPTPIRRRSVAVAAMVLLVAGLAGGALYRRGWLERADGLVHAAIAAERGEAALPPGVELHPFGLLVGDYTTADLEGPYVLLSGQAGNPPRHFLDTFVAPREWTSEVRFQSGVRLETNVWRMGGDWKVTLGRTFPPVPDP